MNGLSGVAAAIVMAAAMLATPCASAHANLKSASPEAGAILAAAPRQITLAFSEKVEEAFSSVSVADAQGRKVSTAKARVDAANPSVVNLDLPALAAGAYTVKWAVAGHDGHRRMGEFQFTVK